MNRGPCTRLVVRIAVASIALVVVPLAVPVYAEVLAQRDGRGDYWYDTRPQDDPYKGEPDGGEQPDLLRTTYSHTSNDVRVRLKLADLGRFGYWRFYARFKTNEGEHRRLELFRDYDGGDRLAVTWSGGSACDVSYRVDLAENVVSVVVPRSCLGGPETVAFRVASNYSPTSDDYPYRDIAGSSGFDFAGWSQALQRG